MLSAELDISDLADMPEMSFTLIIMTSMLTQMLFKHQKLDITITIYLCFLNACIL